MNITYNSPTFTDGVKPLVTLCAPLYVQKGDDAYAERSLRRALDDNAPDSYCDENLAVKYTVNADDAGVYRITRRTVNKSGKTLNVRLIFRIRAEFDVSRYLIPCVSANGNEFGNGGEPKGMEKDGKRWIFAYDRVSVPSCTLVENSEVACSLFASPESMVSSCSVFADGEGRYCQEIHHPVIEAPLTYAYRDTYSPLYENFITLADGEAIEHSFCLLLTKPRYENFGICDTLDYALDVYGDNSDLAVPTADEVWERSMAFARTLISEYKGHRGFRIGFLPDDKGGFAFRGDMCFELAWCGQNVLFARMFICDYIKNGNVKALNDALEILDTRVDLCTAKSGLLASQLIHYEDLDNSTADTCNMGYGAYELLRVYEQLKSIGIYRPKYLAAAKGLCDFFCGHFSDEWGFGKQWRLNGECVDKGGSIGAFVICPMIKLYQMCGDRKYLDMAERAMELYMKRDLDKFCCTAGALDTACVDKETSAPYLMSALMLYEATGDSKYLTYAEKAAYYFSSWMFYYSPEYSEDSEIAKYKVCVKGLTSVSAQHHHLDMYAGIVVPYMYKLARYSENAHWQTIGDMMWRAVLQYISDGTLVVHDRVRPKGSQNEALFHCRWVFKGQGERGLLNDWLVAWPCAFRMSVIADEEFGNNKIPENY